MKEGESILTFAARYCSNKKESRRFADGNLIISNQFLICESAAKDAD